MDRRIKSRACRYLGCERATYEGKPFCLLHVEEHPYVRNLLAELGAREAEMERVKRRGPKAVNLHGTVMADVVQFIQARGGECGAVDLKRNEPLFGQPMLVVQRYLLAMKRARMVKVVRTRGGAMRAELVSAVPIAVPSEAPANAVTAVA